MKRGSEYAKRVKQLFQQMVRKLGKPELPEPTDPIHQLIIAILAENTSDAKAIALFGKICEQMVDLNELRVTPPLELADMIGNAVPQAREKAECIVRVLNEIRARQDTLDLSFLKQRGRREAREYLESLEGAGSAAAASVVVHSLGGHAIPVDYLTVYVLRKEDVVEGSATAAEVQSFLERHVPAADGRMFVTLLNRHVSTEGARVQVTRLPEILNLAPPPPPKPPKRMVMEKPIRPPGAKGDEAEPEPELDALDVEEPVAPEPEPEPAEAPADAANDHHSKAGSSGGKKSSKAAKAKEKGTKSDGITSKVAKTPAPAKKAAVPPKKVKTKAAGSARKKK